MSSGEADEPDGSARHVRSNIRRVALRTTALALVLYVLACAVADLVVVHRLNVSADARLATRLAEVSASSPATGPTRTDGHDAGQNGGGDLDDAPIITWWVAPGAHRAVALVSGAPNLPATAWHVASPTDLTIAGRDFRLEGVALDGGRLIAGTSAQGARSALSTLLAIEAVLAPVVLLILYGAASVIGHGAATPVERARRRQLEFTADASHELRTPLSVIEAEVGLALSSPRTADAYRGALERVADESKRLRDIVEDLLWLARLDALPAEPPAEQVDLTSVADVCAERFAAVAAHRAITIARSDVNGAAILVAPADWLDRLVSVLIDNACRYAGEGGRVEVAVASTRERVVLTVDDSGPGIPDEERENVFRRFHRASPVPGGAGLGLAIANVVVEATGGRWKIDRAPIGGARIEVSWPAVIHWSAPST